MKKAVIIIVVCIAIAIVGLYGLMNTANAEPKENEELTSYQKTIASMDSFMDSQKNDRIAPLKPYIAPATTFVVGLLGLCYGVYSLSTKKQSPKSPTAGGG